MFGLLRPRAGKFVSGTPLGLRLFSGASCRMQAPKLPYTGPPSYDTVARRFSSEVDPRFFYQVREERKAREAGAGKPDKILDHFSPIDPDEFLLHQKDFDTSIPDINFSKLKNEISDVVGIPYHSPATREEADKVVKTGDCFLYGREKRTIFPAVVTAPHGKAYWVFFVINPASPLTILSTQTIDLLGIAGSRRVVDDIGIAGYPHTIHRPSPDSRSAEVDVLGMDFFLRNGVSQVNDFQRAWPVAKLLFDNGAWKTLVEDAKL